MVVGGYAWIERVGEERDAASGDGKEREMLVVCCWLRLTGERSCR